jgi:hypothetical protein
MKHGVLPDGVRIVAQASDYEATVDGDGIIWLPTGDAFVSLDEAGKAVTGGDKCDGLEFWRVAQPDGSAIPIRMIRDKAKADGRLVPTHRRR